MAIPSWPTDIPSCPLLDSVQVQQTAEAPIRTEMNAGTTRARRKFSLRVARVSFPIVMKNDEVVNFRLFHERTLGDGAARFTIPILFAGARVIRTAQFAEQPSYEPAGSGRTKVNISLRVESL